MKKSFLVVLTLALCPAAFSQPVAAPAAPVTAVVRTNTAIVPAERGDERGRARTQEVLKRAKDAPGNYDIAFIGDSITQGWERSGKSVWDEHFGPRRCINFGVGGDRTQHVLWRFEQGQLDGIKPKFVVLMIGTNNSNKEDNTESDILEGVATIVKQIRHRLPETKILLFGIFPRGQTFSAQRGKILQVNQALQRQADGKNVIYLDIGSQLIEKDGSISKEIMPDYLHLSQQAYDTWAKVIDETIRKAAL